MNGFESAHLKVERARELLEDLDRAREAVTTTAPFRLSPEYEADGTITIRIRLRDPNFAFPPKLALLAGDVAHSLRCAIDHVAYELALRGTGPTAGTQFPVFDRRSDYMERASRQMAGMTNGARQLCERLQPFHVYELIGTGGPKHDALREQLHAGTLTDQEIAFWLSAIARLDNLDKHRLILPSRALVPLRKPIFSGVKRIRIAQPRDWVPVVDGAILYRILQSELLPGSVSISIDSPTEWTIVYGQVHERNEDLSLDRALGAVSRSDLEFAAQAVERVTAFAEHLD